MSSAPNSGVADSITIISITVIFFIQPLRHLILRPILEVYRMDVNSFQKETEGEKVSMTHSVSHSKLVERQYRNQVLLPVWALHLTESISYQS